MLQPPAANRLRLRVLVPRGALPRWLGEVLQGLDSLPSIALQVQALDAAPQAPPAPAWAPDAAARADLARWQAAATTADADIALAFDAALHALRRDVAKPTPIETPRETSHETSHDPSHDPSQ